MGMFLIDWNTQKTFILDSASEENAIIMRGGKCGNEQDFRALPEMKFED